MSVKETGLAAMARGEFILLEGADRVGKSTQVRMLAAALRDRGREVETVAFPARHTATGRLISAHLRGEMPDIGAQALHLLFAANRHEMQAQIRDTLARGATLIADRYSLSGVAYSAALGAPVGWLEGVESTLARPDVMIVLRCDPGDAARRGGYGDELYETLEFQARVVRAMEGLDARKYAAVSHELDVTGADAEAVHRQVLGLLGARA